MRREPLHVTTDDTPLAQVDADFLALPVSEPGRLSPAGVDVDVSLGGRLAHLIADGELKAATGSVTLVHTLGELGAHRVVAVGIGKADELDADALRTAAARVAARAAGIGGGTIAWAIDDGISLDLGRPGSGCRGRNGARHVRPGRLEDTRRAAWRADASRPLRARWKRGRSSRDERTCRRRMDEPLSGSRRHARERADSDAASRVRHGDRRWPSPSPLRDPRPAGDHRRRDGGVRRRRPGQRNRAAPDRPRLRPSRRTRRHAARTRREGDHLRHGWHLAEAVRPDGRDEVGHGRWSGCPHGRRRRPPRLACRFASSPSFRRPRTCRAAAPIARATSSQR